MMNTILLVACGAMSQQVQQCLPGHRVIVCEDIAGLNVKDLVALSEQVRQAVEEEETPLQVVKALQLLYPREQTFDEKLKTLVCADPCLQIRRQAPEQLLPYRARSRVAEQSVVSTNATDEYYLERASLKRLRKQQQHQFSK